jgi:hypothetical protein
VQFSNVQRNLWLLDEKRIPTVIRDAGKAFILYFPERLPAILLAGLPAVSLEGLPASGVACCLNKSQTKTPFN